MNRWIFIFLFFALGTSLYFWNKNSSESSSQLRSDCVQDKEKGIHCSPNNDENKKQEDETGIAQKKLEESDSILSVLRTCGANVEKMGQLAKLKPKSREFLAKNIFFTKGGEDFVLRTFVKDSQGGSYQQLVLLKLEEEGLGQKQEIAEDHQRNPSEEIIQTYLDGADISRVDSDQRLTLEGGEEILVSFEGDKIGKLLFYDAEGKALCDKSNLIEPK
jgi:hypothetical protein